MAAYPSAFFAARAYCPFTDSMVEVTPSRKKKANKKQHILCIKGIKAISLVHDVPCNEGRRGGVWP
eukprot:1933720-Pleurochrysis_carterae.AAC.1